MNKVILVERLAEKANITILSSRKVIEALASIIIKELQTAEGKVKITGFGTFTTMTRHARGGVNPQKPSERIIIPEVRVAKFKPGSVLKQALKE